MLATIVGGSSASSACGSTQPWFLNGEHLAFLKHTDLKTCCEFSSNFTKERQPNAFSFENVTKNCVLYSLATFNNASTHKHNGHYETGTTGPQNPTPKPHQPTPLSPTPPLPTPAPAPPLPTPSHPTPHSPSPPPTKPPTSPTPAGPCVGSAVRGDTCPHITYTRVERCLIRLVYVATGL
jgi:hypothetical protein